MSEPNHFLRNIGFVIIFVFTLNLVYVSEPAGSFSLFFKSVLVTIIKWCLWVADYVQELGEGIFKDWQSDQQHKYPLPPPPYIDYAIKSTEFVADMLRDLGSLLACGAISYRNYGSANPFTHWPARFVLTGRGLFLSDEVVHLSFTPTWAMKLWPFSLT